MEKRTISCDDLHFQTRGDEGVPLEVDTLLWCDKVVRESTTEGFLTELCQPLSPRVSVFRGLGEGDEKRLLMELSESLRPELEFSAR